MAYQLTVTPKDKPYNEIQNYAAFAAIKSGGSVVAWGGGVNGGDIPSDIATQLTNVKQIFSSGYAFAALKNDGSVVSWGTDGNNSPINTPNMTNVKTISSTETAFAALTNDGNVVAWGNADKGGSVISLTDVKEIYANNSAFAALKNDGSVVTWGDTNAGGSSSSVNLTHVDKIFSTRDAFAALKTDGSVVAWGASGGNITSTIQAKFNDSSYKVINISSTDGAFAALREDGSVVYWGDSYGGGYSDGVTLAALNDPTKKVVNIFSNSGSFAALRADHSVVRWGGYSAGLDVIENISKIFSSGNSFAAITDNGSVIAWGIGESDYGGDSSNVSSQLNDSSNRVTAIYSTFSAFAALRQDGSVVTWGDGVSGGDSSKVTTEINGAIDVKEIFTTSGGEFAAFAALREDGSVVTWGNLAFDSFIIQTDIVSFANATTDDNYVLAHLPILPPTPSTPTPPQPVVIENYSPTGSVSITGTPAQGQVLTVSNNLADANGFGAVSYQWFNNTGAIQNATQTTYTLTQSDVGKTFSVTASYTDGAGFSTSVASASTTAVENVNDAPTGSVLITGTATQGQVLTVTNTLADLDGMGTVSYQWYAGANVISSATSSTYILTQAEVGKAVTVKASYTDGGGTLEMVSSSAIANIFNINDAPTGSVLITGTATQGQVLTASNTLADLDGMGTVSYQWYAGANAISGATASTFTLTQAEVGKVVTVKVSYTDGGGTLEIVSSLATANIENINDAPKGAVLITGTATQGQVLTASNTLADLDGMGTVSYQWYAGANAISGATASTTFTLTQAEVGKAVTVKASYTDGGNALETVSSSATVNVTDINDVPTGSVLITGASTQGQVLTASNTLADLDGMGTVSYQWYAGANAISDATSTTFTLTQAEVGKAVTVKASYTDGVGIPEIVSSSATANVVNINDVHTGSVLITGTATQGQVLTASNTLADLDGVGTVSYQWYAGSNAISGARSTTFTLTQAEVGKAVTVKASYIDGGNRLETVSSIATANIANINDVPTGSVLITCTATQGQVLTASNTLADLDGMGTVSYQWYAGANAISGATASTFTLTQAEVGKSVTVKASYTDGGNALETVSSSATVNVTDINDVPMGSVLITGTVTQGQVLTASNTLADLDGMGTVSYQWYAGANAISDATSTTFTLTQAEVGKSVTVKASYTDGGGTLEMVSSLATANIENINDAPTGSVLITGTATQGQVLTASNTLADADGMGTVSYQWYAGANAISDAMSTTFTLTQAEVGKSVTVKASYTDGVGMPEMVSSSATANVVNINDLPTGTVTITGTATQNQTLTANIDTLVDLDGIGDIAYQWQRSSTDIPSATGSTYVLTQADVNQPISVKASYSDKFGASESVSSVATAKIVDVNDKPSGRVSISGTTAQNHILTASNDLSDLDGLGPISYQWSRNNVDILNATQATYALTQIDVGKVVTVKASYTDGLGKLESVIGGFFSPGLDPLTIANENDSPKGTVSITGMAKKGHVLSVSNTLTDVDGLGEVHYQWLNEGNVIADANQASYALTQADVGKNISVKASYTDLQNTNESLASTALRIAANKAPTGAITLKGSPVWGATLSASSILKDGDGLGKLSYSWQNEAGELSTSPSYRLGEDDIDTNVWLTVQYTDKKGNIEEVNSKPVDVKISKKSSAYNDILEGTAAADTLSGLGGNDTLVGGAGSDKLTGGKGSDIFVFTSLDFYTTDSNGGLVFNKSVDTVTDFNLKAYDMLDFGDLGELSFYPSLKDAQDDLASLFYVKGSGKIYLNTNDADGFTPTVIVLLTGKPAVNTDLTDWNYPAV